MFRLVVFALIALQCLTLIQTRQRRPQLVIYNMTCDIITTTLKQYECNFHKKAKGQYIVSHYLMSSKDIANDFHARLWLQYRSKNGRKPVTFFDVTVNVCEALKKIEGRFLSMLLNEVIKFSNLPASCPFQANVLYKLPNQSITSALIPPYTPFLNFSYKIELYHKRILFCASKTMGAIVADG